MTKIDRRVEGFAVGAGAAAVSAASIAAIKFGASQEALLGLLGALIGAATTVAGAVWLADRNVRIEQDAEVRLLSKEFQLVRTSATSALALAPESNEDWSDEYVNALRSLDMPIRETHSITKEALDHGKRLSFRMRMRLRQVEAASERVWNFYEDSFLQEGDLEYWDERTWPDQLSHLIEVIDLALGEFSHVS